MSNTLHPLSSLVFPALPGNTTTSKVVLFVHGIFSNHETFETLARKLRENGIGPDYDFRYFDYDFNQSISLNGLELALQLKAIFGSAAAEVTIIGHSMGGLVARLALLQEGHELPFVKRLMMLGTPNHGTLHTGRLGLLAHITREATGVAWSVLTSKTGVKELTELDRLLASYLTEESEPRTRHVEYVTIPGLFYQETTGLLRMKPRGTSLGLRALNLAFEFTKAMPFWTAGMKKPHDGIVEESSVYLGARVKTRFSERRATCEGVPDCGPYTHVIHKDHQDADHVTIQTTDRTATILAEILKAPSIAAWRKNAEKVFGYSITPLRITPPAA